MVVDLRRDGADASSTFSRRRGIEGEATLSSAGRDMANAVWISG